MTSRWKARLAVLAWAGAGLLAAAGQDAPAPAAEAAGAIPDLKLGVPMLRAALDGPDDSPDLWDRIPDFRLKLESPMELLRSPFDWQDRIRGVEIRMAASPVWLGYEQPREGEDMEEGRATFSIQQKF